MNLAQVLPVSIAVHPARLISLHGVFNAHQHPRTTERLLMDITSLFSDDQLAILGCFGALAVCGLIAALSFHLGPAGRQRQQVRMARLRNSPETIDHRLTRPSDRRAA